MREEIKGKLFFVLAVLYLLLVGAGIFWYYFQAKNEIGTINQSIEINLES